MQDREDLKESTRAIGKQVVERMEEVEDESRYLRFSITLLVLHKNMLACTLICSSHE